MGKGDTVPGVGGGGGKRGDFLDADDVLFLDLGTGYAGTRYPPFYTSVLEVPVVPHPCQHLIVSTLFLLAVWVGVQ